MLDQKLANEIIAAVDAGFDAQLQETMALTRLPSLRGQEATAQDFMARHYRARGLSVDHWKINVADIEHLPGFSPVAVSYDNAFNVVATHRPREKKGRSLIMNGHIDVVPTGPADLWTRPPFDSYISGDWLYGRGAGDMKAGLWGCVAAFDALDRLGLRPAAEVYLQSVVEEECTGNGALACASLRALVLHPAHDSATRAQAVANVNGVRMISSPPKLRRACAWMRGGGVSVRWPWMPAWSAPSSPRRRGSMLACVTAFEGRGWQRPRGFPPSRE